MFKKGTFSLSSIGLILRALITAIFLIGFLPAPALAQTEGVIAGQVTDNATGNPIAGVTIFVFEPSAPSPTWTGNTDNIGIFGLPIPAGTGYGVAARKDGYVTQRTDSKNVTTNATTTVNFSLLQGGIIQGIISDNSSNPVQNANVRAYLPAAPGTFYSSLSTNISGQYSLTVPPGTGYTVEAAKQGFASANQTEVSAAIGSPTTVNLTLLPPPDSTPPANITNLTTGNVTDLSVILTWTAPGDDGATGQASQYDIRYATSIIIDDETKWNNAQPAQHPPPHAAGFNEIFTVDGLSANTTYFFAIKTRDDANLWSGLSNSPPATTLAGPPQQEPPPPPPGISIAHISGKSAFTLGAGDNTTEIFNITSVNNFAGTVQLFFGGAPTGIQANSSLNPAQVTLTAGETRSVTLNLNASADTALGTYFCTLVGQATGIQPKVYGFAVNVGMAGMPLLWASPPVVAAGGQTTFFTCKFAADANITLKWDSGPRATQTLATGLTSENGTWNTTVTIPSENMTVGNFAVKATTASNSAVFNLTITSGSTPDFLMTASPQFISTTPGGSSNVTISITSVNGFNAPVILTPGSPPGITLSLSTNNVTPSSGQAASATLTVSVADWVAPNMYHINVGGACTNPSITKMMDISLDIQPLGQWGPGLSLSQSYGVGGDSITITGANFPSACNGQTVTVIEAVTGMTVTTTPSTITVSNGGFTGTFTLPPIVMSGNYRIKAIVASTGDFAERDFQILGAGETFTLGVSPTSVTVTTEQGQNSALVTVNIFSVGGNSPSVNLGIDGAPPWLTYQFGSLPVNTSASGSNNVSVPAGGSASLNLQLTATMTAPTGNYPITVRGWVNGSPEQRVSLQLSVQPPSGFGMAEFTLSPAFGEGDRTVNFSGSGFTSCNTSQVTELRFGGLNILTLQSLPPITVPTSGDSAGRFSGSFRVPSELSPGTYPVDIRVGLAPYDKFISKPFTITGGSDTYVLQASPAFLWVQQGGQIHSMIQVQAVGSSSANVSLSLEGCPADITTTFASGNVTAPPGGTGSTDLGLTTQSWLPAGHYTITVKGQLAGGAEVHRIPLEIEVAPPAGFNMASIYLSPTSGYVGTWVTLSGSGFPVNTALTNLYFGPPNPQNDQVANGTLPAISTDENGAFSAVLQVPPGLTPGMYPIEAIVGTYPDDRRAMADFTFVSDQATFNINLSPMMIQAAPGTSTSTSVNIQAFGSSSANITLRVEGPPTIEWRFDGGSWNYSANVSPPIGGTLMSSLEIQPKPSTSMGHYSLAVKATAGEQTEMRNLEIDIGASAGYNMPIFSLNPNTGTAGTNVSFSGSNFPPDTQISGITFGSANITLAQAITTSPQGSFSGAFTVPGTVGGQPIAAGTYPIRAFVGQGQAEAKFNVYGSGDTFILSLSPNFLQGGPGTEARTSGLLKALGGASPTIKMAVKGLPPGVETNWNGTVQPSCNITAPPGGQNNFELGLVLPNMIPMGQYPAVLEGWVDTIDNNVWDTGEKITRVNLELSIMPPQGYGMGMLSLSPTYGRVGDTITVSGSGFPATTAVQSLTFAQTDVLSNVITTSADGSFSGVFTVPNTAFGNPTGPGRYPVDIVVGTYPNDRRGGFEFQVVSSDQKFSVSASPGWLARPSGDTASVSISVRSLVTNPPSPIIILRVEGLPMGVTPSFTSANITPPVGGMEGRELQLTISNSCPMGNYPISVRAYNAANTAEEIWANFTLEVTPSSGFMDMGMAMVTLSPNFGSVGSQVTVSGYGFPKSQNLTHIHFGSPNNYVNVTPMSVNTTTDATGAFSAVVTVPSLPSGMQPVEVNVQNTIRAIPFNIMGDNDTFSLNVSPGWLEPIPAGDPNGRQIAITVTGLPGKTPTVTLSIEGLFAAYGTITQTWDPTSRTANVTSAGGAATATLTLIPSENLPPGPYPFNIVAVDSLNNRRDYHMEFQVGPPAGFMGMAQQGIYFPDIFLSPRSGPAGTQISYTGTNLPAGANVTSITFAGRTVLLPAGGITADSNGGFSGTLVVEESWNLPPGGMYFVNFRLEKETWRQDIGKDFNLVRSNATFTLEANPNWLPPIAQGGTGQTVITVKAMGYNSANLTLAVMETFGGMGMPGGAVPHWNNATTGPATDNATVPGGGQTTKDFYLQGNNPGHYMITIIGWIDSNNNQIMEPNIPSEAESAFPVSLEFDVQPPQGFMNWDKQNMITSMNMTAANDMYLFYFPEIVVNPNMGQADTKVNISATNFPAGANVTHLRFAGAELPVPSTTADGTGSFNLVFSVPRTIWVGNIASGWYDVEVEAQKTGEPPVSIRKPFQVTAGDIAFTIWAEPNFLPPIATSGNASTLIRVKSTSSAANITLSIDKIPPGVTTSFSSNTVNVTAGGAGSATLTLTPTTIPPGHYGAEIKGTTGSATFFTHIEFDIQPPTGFMNWDREAVMGRMDISNDDKYLLYFPEIVLNPNMGQAGNKVSITATDFPAGANVTYLRFAGMQLPVPPNTAADNITGAFTLVFNVPRTIWGGNIGPGWYDVEVEAQKVGEPPVFIRKPFQVTGDIAFTMMAEPNWLPPIPPSGSTTTIRVTSMGAGANVTLSMDKIPPGITTSFSPTSVNVPPGGSGTATLTLTPTNIPPGHYGAEIKGTTGSATFFTHIEFDIQPPTGFMNWIKQDMMTSMNMTASDKYLLYFPEIILNPNMGQAGNKVSITATDFPAGANVTYLRFAGMGLPVPVNTAADNITGAFTLVFNVPRTIWGGNIGPGWYDVEVEAQKVGEPPVFIRKPFQVTTSDVAFAMRADPNFLPPIPPAGSSTTIRIESLEAGANVTLTMDKIPAGITWVFAPTWVDVPPGGSGTTTLTLTPANIPPGHYGAEIKGTATISGSLRTVYAHIEFDVQPSTMFKDTTWMQAHNVWFPEITLNPGAGPVKTKVTISATDFPAGANVTQLRFAGRALPVPPNTVADSNGNANLVFNVPGDFGVGQYMVEVEAQKPDLSPVFIAKPFFIQDADVTFKLNVTPSFMPGVTQGSSGNTTVSIESTSRAVTVQLYVDGLPPGVTPYFDNTTLTVAPGSLGSTRLTITTRASTPPGQYPLTIRGVSGNETRVMPFGFGVMPPANFGMPKFTLNPDYAPAGYTDKQYKITFSGTGFPVNRSVSSLKFGSANVSIPANLVTDANGNFNGVFQMPIGLDSGTYDVRVAVADSSGGFVYDSRPFSIRGAGAKFILQLSPPYLPPVLQGGNVTITVNTKSVGTTSANITLYVDGLAPGITATFTPSNNVTVSPGGSGSATITLNVSGNTPPGPYPVSIRGITGNEAAVVPLGFGVMPNIGAGEGHGTITINPPRARPGEHIGISGAGFTSGNTITLTAAPPGASANTTIDITPTGGTILVQSDDTWAGTWATEITVPLVPPGTYIIKASDGVMAAKNTFSIVPAENADFFLNLSPQFLKVAQGYTGNTTLTLSSQNGYKEAVRFSVGHLPPGVTATFQDTLGNTIGRFAGMPGGIREIITPTPLLPIPGEALTITVLIVADAATPIGPYDIPLEARTSTIARAVPLGLMVVSTGANMIISPSSGSADTDIRLSGSGYTAGETVRITFASNNITTVPAAITVAQDGTFTALITAPSMSAGIYSVKATVGNSGISIDRPFSLKPSAVSFVLYTSPMKVDVPRGGSGNVTAKIEPLGSFQSAVVLSVSGLSNVNISGASASISPSATIIPSVGTPTTATITLNVPANATEGKYTLIVTGTSGAITKTQTITLNVVPLVTTPDFAINLAPNAVPVSPNASGNVTVTVTALNSFDGTVNLAVAMSSNATWPSSISATAATVTPSANTGLGKQEVTFTAAADTQPGTWTFRVTGTSGILSHSTEVMVICTPAGTTVTTFASPLLDPTTVTSSTPIDMTAPWGDKITINGIINDGAEASVITPTSVNVTPETLATLPEGATDMLGRITNVDSSTPVDGVQWEIGFPFDPTDLTAAGLEEENLKVIYLNPDTNTWTEVITTIDSTNKIAYASPTHFSSWSLIATPAPPTSEVVTVYGGGGGGGGTSGVTSIAEYITGDGRFVIDTTVESVDSLVEINIPKNTIGKNKAGQRLYSISIKESTAPSAAPADTRIIGKVYDIGPSGATFAPPVNLTFEYNDSLVPAGVAEENLVIATWQDGSWIELEGGTVDPVNNTITAPISHFSIYTIMAHTAAASFKVSDLKVALAEINPDESATVTATITNIGDLTDKYEVTLTVNESVTATQVVNLAGHASREVSFTLKPDKAGTYTVKVGGITATLIVREASAATEEEPAPSETPATPSETESAPPEVAPAPAEIQPVPFEEPEAPAEVAPVVPEISAQEAKAVTRISDWLILLYVVAAGVIIIGLVYWRTRTGRKAS